MVVGSIRTCRVIECAWEGCTETFEPFGPPHARKRFCSAKHREYYDARRPGKNRRRWLWRRYGLREEAFDALFQAQSGKCAICQEEQQGRSLTVDHDHDTGEVRALLCRECNLGLGQFKDNLLLLRRAVNYMEEHDD